MAKPVWSDIWVMTVTDTRVDDGLAPLVVVVGPTAVGKSELALDLAAKLGAEIVNADSMQLYQGMDIGTAKLPISERNGIPHHLLDIWPIDYEANVSEYQRLARSKISELRSEGTPVVLVGGSGLYINAVIDQLEFPGTDPVIRARLYQELESLGIELLHDRLRQLDPATATSIDMNNARRIIRALEVIEITGKQFTPALPRDRRHLTCTVVGLNRDRADLDQLIGVRVQQMWQAGLLAEIEHLRSLGLDSAPTAAKALGYAQGISQLVGELTADEAQTATAVATRRFARRQLSWFRRDSGIVWFDLPTGQVDCAKRHGEILVEILAIVERS